MQLIINTFGTSLRRKGDRFIIKAGDKQVALSAQKVQSIVIATGAHFSSDAIHLASQRRSRARAATRPKTEKKFRRVKQRAVIQHEAHALANALIGRRDLPKIVETSELWSDESS